MTARSWRRIGAWLSGLLLVTLLGLVAVAAAVLVVIPRATHGVALTVLTGSMTPKLPVGSVVIDRSVDTRTLRVGDVATYQKAPGRAEYITHRIVAINDRTTPRTFTFKGDANRGPDADPVPATAIRGKVWLDVPYLGSARDSLRGGSLRGLAIAAAVLALGGYAVAQFVGAARQHRRGRVARAQGDDSAADDAGSPPDIPEVSRV
jgi:signal peptidase I